MNKCEGQVWPTLWVFPDHYKCQWYSISFECQMNSQLPFIQFVWHFSNWLDLYCQYKHHCIPRPRHGLLSIRYVCRFLSKLLHTRRRYNENNFCTITLTISFCKKVLSLQNMYQKTENMHCFRQMISNVFSSINIYKFKWYVVSLKFVAKGTISKKSMLIHVITRHYICDNLLTHWGRVTHICVSKLTIIGSDHDLSPGRRHAITRTSFYSKLFYTPNNISWLWWHSIEHYLINFRYMCIRSDEGN